MTKHPDNIDPAYCKAYSRSTGQQCKKRPVFGLEVCRNHGGATKAAKDKSARARIVGKMSRFVEPISADDPLNDPIAAFEAEFRRTLGRIRWYDEELAQLEADALIWGQTKQEVVGASEFEGVNDTYEAQASLLHELQFRERQHLLAMEKVWIGAKLDSRRLEIQASYVQMLDKALSGVLSALGHDPSDPGVRAIVRQELLALPTKG